MGWWSGFGYEAGVGIGFWDESRGSRSGFRWRVGDGFQSRVGLGLRDRGRVSFGDGGQVRLGFEHGVGSGFGTWVEVWFREADWVLEFWLGRWLGFRMRSGWWLGFGVGVGF